MVKLILIVLLMDFGLSYGQHADLSATYRFLNIPSTPRMAALGGSNTALPGADVSAFMLNPAYLNETSHGQLSLSYLNHIADLSMGFTSAAWHFDHIGTFAFGIRFLGYGSDLEHTNAAGENLGTFNASDAAFTLGYGYQFNEQLQLGGSVQFIRSSYHVYSSSGISFAGGAFYSFSDELTWAGLSITNVGAQLTYFDDVRETLPVDVRATITRRLIHLPLRFSATAHSLTSWELSSFNDEQQPGFFDYLFRHLILSGEFLFSDHFHFRLGYNHYLHEETKSDSRIDLGGFSYGVGISIQNFQFDFSRNSYSDLGSLTQIGIQYQL